MRQDLLKPFTVSAPGSVMITGEHAVVAGYRAIVCAIDQRIR
ncbi:MAG: galactokinase family protein, partial [Pseudomonadota bacterium]